MHGVVLTPDYTLLYQVGIFFACYFVLKFLVFNPYLALLEARHEKTDGLREKAILSREKAVTFKTDYEAFMANERAKVAAWSDEERRKVAEEERKIIGATRDKVGKELEAHRSKIKEETKKARAELLSKVPDVASEMTRKVLGEKDTIPSSSFKIKSRNGEASAAR